MFKPSYLLMTSLLALSGAASAAMLSGTLNVDNGYVAYISSANNIQGTQVSAGNHWPTAYQFSNVNLTSGQDYYLHIYAYDQGWIAGFLGEFLLTGSGHTFANGDTRFATNTVGWGVSKTGWDNYQDATNWGANGAYPWGLRPEVDASAEWIWSDNAYDDDQAYFTTLISAVDVAEPSSMLLMGLGVAGLFAARKKMK